MSEFRISFKEVEAKVEELRSLNSQLKNKVTQMESMEGNLVSMWEGTARDNFDNAFKSDKAQMDNFTTTIDKFADALMNIVNRYAQAESQNAEIGSTRSYR